MTEERGWQDVMIENRLEKDWIKEAMHPEKSLMFCGRLCEVILILEKQLEDKGTKGASNE